MLDELESDQGPVIERGSPRFDISQNLICVDQTLVLLNWRGSLAIPCGDANQFLECEEELLYDRLNR